MRSEYDAWQALKDTPKMRHNYVPPRKTFNLAPILGWVLVVVIGLMLAA